MKARPAFQPARASGLHLFACNDPHGAGCTNDCNQGRACPPLPSRIRDTDTVAQAAGNWFVAKWRERLANAEGDVQLVARQMRKVGTPLEVAVRVLAGGVR